jgi:hypothetical protein
MKRHDIWKKKVLPEKVVKYIIDCCKKKETPADVEQMIKAEHVQLIRFSFTIANVQNK